MNPTRNRLAQEKSPYLLQHAHNPVDWYPWCEEAFEKARSQDKPIFLSIGYATCHWCHVMERESFENPEIAALMNDHFVCIKVDREERPDIDDIYMTVCQMMTGSGGWPLSIFMTPDCQPFFAGTYIPPEGRFGRAGMLEAIPQLSNVWKTRRDDVLESAVQVTQRLSQEPSASGALDENLLEQAYEDMLSQMDDVYGGFGDAPKFPTTHRLVFLIRQNAEGAKQKVLETLDAMHRGGIWDHVGFGIHRYSTDREWLVPHFEKMLYDQALFILACVETFEAYGDENARRMAEQTIEYVLRDMTAPGGGFYSAEDADSEGEEGKFYIWGEDELRKVLDPNEFETVAAMGPISVAGNFRDEATKQKTGFNILHRSPRGAELPEAVRKKLFAVREKRIHPLKDTKVLADWNGLMIAALAKAGRVFRVPEYTKAAQHAADFVLSEMADGDRLWHRWREGQPAVPGQLDDYAFMIFGLLELYESTFDFQTLEKILQLNQEVLDHFQDKLSGGFYLTADDAEALIVRPKSSNDGALPSGNFMHMFNLIRLARLTGQSDLETLADRTGRAFAGQVNRIALAFPQAMQALQFASGKTVEVVIVGDLESESTRAQIDAVRAGYWPLKTVLFKTPDDPKVEALISFTKDMSQPAVYICRNFACEAPVKDPAAVREALG